MGPNGSVRGSALLFGGTRFCRFIGCRCSFSGCSCISIGCRCGLAAAGSSPAAAGAAPAAGAFQRMLHPAAAGPAGAAPAGAAPAAAGPSLLRRVLSGGCWSGGCCSSGRCSSLLVRQVHLHCYWTLQLPGSGPKPLPCPVDWYWVPRILHRHWGCRSRIRLIWIVWTLCGAIATMAAGLFGPCVALASVVASSAPPQAKVIMASVRSCSVFIATSRCSMDERFEGTKKLVRVPNVQRAYNNQ